MCELRARLDNPSIFDQLWQHVDVVEVMLHEQKCLVRIFLGHFVFTMRSNIPQQAYMTRHLCYFSGNSLLSCQVINLLFQGLTFCTFFSAASF